MKLQKTALLGVLLLALSAGLANAAPAPEANEIPEMTQMQPAVARQQTKLSHKIFLPGDSLKMSGKLFLY